MMCGRRLWLRSMTHYEKKDMGGCAEATRKICGGIQIDLKGEACSRRKRGEVQGVLHGKGVFIEGGH